MIFIADSGSTKTDWRILDRAGKVSQARTSGMNPYHETAASMARVLQEELLPQLSEDTDTTSVREIFFYGAGCATETACASVAAALRKVFSAASPEVNNAGETL